MLNLIKCQKKKRLFGRGKSSSKGRTAGRGSKGQGARGSCPAMALENRHTLRTRKYGTIKVGRKIATLSISLKTLERLVVKYKLTEIDDKQVIKLLNKSPQKHNKVKVYMTYDEVDLTVFNKINLSGYTKSVKEALGDKIMGGQDL